MNSTLNSSNYPLVASYNGDDSSENIDMFYR